MATYQHSTGTFIGKGGIEIFFQQWEVANPKAVLIIIHGLGEHSGRYGNLIDALQNKGIAIFGLDHRGFGRSGGKRGHTDSFMDYI
ncbi:MAG TPA: alpha/beta hydrolase, partial [Spirochaetota bacterium]|nr:alpha/beta hydrolase [Spirochaetota bacterium]